MKQKIIFILLLCFFLGFSSQAKANSAMPISFSPFWCSFGLNLGGFSGHGGDSGFQIGAEASVFYIFYLGFAGIYADSIHKSHGNYFSIGPEIGVFSSIVNGGIDFGYLTEISGKMKGMTFRLFLSFGIVPIFPYIRYNAFRKFNDEVEYGLLFKLPLET
ncbi:MAG: hypothetical protein A2Y41_07375 [Spirochaetes bacterium GWB1_36_13]|nr:MAG: hypothetical protein A2Y41_07375 [Spirochaetes bacterium GWB1_36_13]